MRTFPDEANIAYKFLDSVVALLKNDSDYSEKYSFDTEKDKYGYMYYSQPLTMILRMRPTVHSSYSRRFDFLTPNHNKWTRVALLQIRYWSDGDFKKYQLEVRTVEEVNGDNPRYNTPVKFLPDNADTDTKPLSQKVFEFLKTGCIESYTKQGGVVSDFAAEWDALHRITELLESRLLAVQPAGPGLTSPCDV